MSRLLEIAAGWYNMINSTRPLQEMARARLEVCEECPEKVELNGLAAAVISLANSANSVADNSKPIYRCGICGCALSAKALSPDSSCPLGKW